MSVETLCKQADLEPGTAKRFDIGSHRIALVRIGDDFYAIADRCSHADFSLSEGDVFSDTKEIECWKHGSVFSCETGKPQNLPATKPVPTYKVTLENDEVKVDLP